MDESIAAANGQSRDGRATTTSGLPILVFLLLVTVAALALFWFDPSRHSFYPGCYFNRVTGFYCPGCGSLRALHQLFHGRIGAAFHFNALTISALPIVGWIAVKKMVRGRGAKVAGTKTAWLWGALAVVVIFGVARNLPLPVCNCLAPPHS